MSRFIISQLFFPYNYVFYLNIYFFIIVFRKSWLYGYFSSFEFLPYYFPYYFCFNGIICVLRLIFSAVSSWLSSSGDAIVRVTRPNGCYSAISQDGDDCVTLIWGSGSEPFKVTGPFKRLMKAMDPLPQKYPHGHNFAPMWIMHFVCWDLIVSYVCEVRKV